MKCFKIHTKDDTTIIQANDKDEAFAKYFKDILDGKIPLEKIGNIIVLKDEQGKEYPFRTVPVLFKMGVINEEGAVANLLALGVADSKADAKKLLQDTAKQDAWLAEKIMGIKG